MPLEDREPPSDPAGEAPPASLHSKGLASLKFKERSMEEDDLIRLTGHALQGLLANPTATVVVRNNATNDLEIEANWAHLAVRYADATQIKLRNHLAQ